MLSPLTLSPLPANPLVSVLVANYNYASYVAAAIESIQQQSYAPIEIIVCDDGSTDDSRAVVGSMAKKDSRIRLVEQENAGVAAALNRAYAVSRGEIVCLLDADDFFKPGKLSILVQAMQEAPDAGFVQHAMEVVDDRGQFIKTLPAHGLFESGWIAERVIARGGRWRNMPASALSFRRKIADLLFPFPEEELRSMADAYLYMLAPLFTKVAYLPESLSAYRLHGANLTGSLLFDAKVSRKYVKGIERVHRCITAVGSERKLGIPVLDANLHLNYLEHAYMQRLFEGEKRRILWPMYRRLARMIRNDDLYPFTRKIKGQLLLGTALLMPKGWRKGWINLLST